MKIFRDLSEIHMTGKSSVTVGTFDGLHLGHQRILAKLEEIAARDYLNKTVVTFDPHPKKVVGKNPKKAIRILTTTAEKIHLLKEAGIDQLVIIPFTKEFAALSSEAFVKTILIGKLLVKEMVIGYDHHFGHNREGGVVKLETLGRELGFSVREVLPVEIGGEVVSSTAIRNSLTAGDVEKGAQFMGRLYTISGTVVKGKGRGKEIGFPTANIAPDDPDKLIPAKGVYAVDVLIDQSKYRGMMNIGRRPTFDFDPLTLEVHLFNFYADLYEKALSIRFKKFIRPEKKFTGIEELRAQLANDKIKCEQI